MDRQLLLAGSIFGYANAAILLLFAVIVAWRLIEYYPENHVAYDIRLLYIPGGIGLLLAAFGFSAGKRMRGFLLCFTVSLVLIAAVFALDHYSIIVEYNCWCERGMPDPFQNP